MKSLNNAISICRYFSITFLLDCKLSNSDLLLLITSIGVRYMSLRRRSDNIFDKHVPLSTASGNAKVSTANVLQTTLFSSGLPIQ